MLRFLVELGVISLDKPKYLISNLVYGDKYTKLFTRNHLKSILDPSNLPTLAKSYDIEYMIYTDHETARTLAYDPGMQELAKYCKISSQNFSWPAGKVQKYDYRYGLILEMVKGTINKGITENFDAVTTWVADLVVAQEFFPRVLSRIEQGHDAVFVVPLRSADEAVTPNLHKFHGALKDVDLCALCIECLHPLWVAANWNNPQFTKLPFTLLWQAPGGLLARTIQPTPIVFKPKVAMLEGRCMIDADIPAHFDNPFWAHDWINAPVAGVEPLICYYPPFANRPASASFVKEFYLNVEPTQPAYLSQQMFYPSRALCEVKPETFAESDRVVGEILA